ncbi:hypothetical protein BGZ98_005184 [Dissophora globulifera]|nr:hypothetical protein BGZ98_005184 [Dissophora globulifera]
MGIKYAWPLLRRKGPVPDSQGKVSLVSIISKIRVYVCPTQIHLFDTIAAIPTDLYAAQDKLERGCSRLATRTRLKMRLYVDSTPAVEKKQTHAKRHQGRQKALIKAAAAISNVELRLADRKRIRKHHIVLKSHVEKQERPLYLHPIGKDGNHPWLERGRKRVAQPEDAPGPSQHASSSGGRTSSNGRKCTEATMAKQKATTRKGKARQVDS